MGIDVDATSNNIVSKSMRRQDVDITLFYGCVSSGHQCGVKVFLHIAPEKN